jgi:hypothetical protein
MYRSCASRLSFCIALLTPLGLEARADPIQMTVTGNAGFGPVNYTQVLADDTLGGGYYSPPGALGSKMVGPAPTGPINAGISLTIGLTDTASPGSQSLTLSLGGSLTGQFIPWDAPGNPSGEPGVVGSGTIDTITINGLNPATNLVVSATTQGPNGMLSAVALAQFASISGLPQSLLATLTTPGQYQIMPNMGDGIEGDYYGSMSITSLSPVPAPEPTPLALLGLATVAYLVRRARASWRDSIPRG